MRSLISSVCVFSFLGCTLSIADEPRPESFETLFSYKDRIYNDFVKKVDFKDDGCTG